MKRLLALFASQSSLAGKLRQEIFALGGRHLGDALGGARRELKHPDLTPERRRLLRGVVRHLSRGGGSEAKAAKAAASESALINLAYVLVIAACAVWATLMIRSLIA